MNKNNLYNYIESKRELWIAIRNKFYNQFKEENLKIVKEHGGTVSELLLKLKFAERDYGKYKMMFNIIEAPSSNKTGLIEREYREFRLLDGTTKILKGAIEKGEILKKNSSLLSLFIFSVIMGVSYIEMYRTAGQDRDQDVPEGKEDIARDISETNQLGRFPYLEEVSSEELQSYTLKVIEHLLKKKDID